MLKTAREKHDLTYKGKKKNSDKRVTHQKPWWPG